MVVVWQLLTTDVTIKANTMIITSRAIRMPLQLRVLGLAETSWNVGRHEIYFIIKLCMILLLLYRLESFLWNCDKLISHA